MNLASLSDRNLEEHGEYERLIFGERSYTNRELHDLGCRLAHALHELGLGSGDKVVVMLPNCPEVLLGYSAVWRIGAVAIPVLFLLDTHELAYILENSAARAVITSNDVYAKVADAVQRVPAVRYVLVAGAEDSVPEGCLSIARLLHDSPPRSEVAPCSKDDLATILYTSGTTGRPKGVMQTHGNLYAHAMNAWRTAGERNRSPRSLIVLPLAHSFGLGLLVSGFLFGGMGVLMRWFNPKEALELIERHRLVGMAGVPTMFLYLLADPDAGKYDTSSVERWLVGAAPMDAAHIAAFERKFGGQLLVGYGLTESCPGISVEREELPRKPGSVGVPMEGVRVKIVDESGRSLPAGERGEICAAGENISPGYYELPEATRDTFRAGWLHTGDIGYLDSDNYLFIVDRKKDLIIRAGLNIYPKDVEEVLVHHPAVEEAAVVGMLDPLMGEEVCAFVVKKYGSKVSAEELISHCQGQLAKYKTPRHVELVSSLPKNNLGKVQKNELRELARRKWTPNDPSGAS
ncbi:MAG TPA: long-chain-fatty-acid--CoA ligase [Polyangiaceae bacterium]|nr:long-chain-fatty-acid--CoA ligase [Polyangiaceae bacterium]